MDLHGETVKHKVFGTGRIIEFDGKYITVLFSENETKRKFVYPAAFGAFLELENTSLLGQIEIAKNESLEALAKTKLMDQELSRLAHPIKLKEGAKRAKKIAPKSNY